jgi:hypothetical protein
MRTTVSELLSKHLVENEYVWRNSGREDSFRYRWVATYAAGSMRLLNTKRCVVLKAPVIK